MAKVIFKSYNPNDSPLLPPCLGDYLPKNHKARVVSAIIDRLDISGIEKGYKGGGTSSYSPRMLLKVIVYAYLNNVYSGRQMEKLLVENIAYMWLSGMQTPDFRTIDLFRSRHLADKFDDIFTQIVCLLHEEGLVSLKVQYIDGTKIESAANKYTFVWKGSTEKNKVKLEAGVRSVLEAAEKVLSLDYYVCPMGQHMKHIGDLAVTSDLGYKSTISRYRARNCNGCPLRGMCYKGASNARVIEVNHKNNAYRTEVKRLLTGERGLYHRSNRPIEPEAVFGDIKFNHGFKRFRLKSNEKVKIEFGLVAMAHNLRKYIAQANEKAN